MKFIHHCAMPRDSLCRIEPPLIARGLEELEGKCRQAVVSAWQTLIGLLLRRSNRVARLRWAALGHHLSDLKRRGIGGNQ